MVMGREVLVIFAFQIFFGYIYLLIERFGYIIPTYNLDGERCKYCRTVIPGRWT
jgi:hypothetical protein